MERRIRELLFEPLREGRLSAIIPDFTVVLPDREVLAPAQLTRDEDDFAFVMHFSTPAPPNELKATRGGTFTRADQIQIRGQIDGTIAFCCTDVFPAIERTERSRGTSSITLRSSKMEFVTEGDDLLTTAEMHQSINASDQYSETEKKSVSAHLIYHGPKLKMYDSGTETISKNDFLGNASKSSLDTHQFAGSGWLGALIQKERELHLHIRSAPDNSSVSSAEEAGKLVDRVNQAVGFTGGFQPWPAYREIRFDHKVIERWMSPRFDLEQGYLVPVSESMWASLRRDATNPIRVIIPTIADGLERIGEGNYARLTNLLWHFRSANSSHLPPSTKMLIVCSVLEGLVKLVGGVKERRTKLSARDVWRLASDKLGFSWERWTDGVFEVWRKHRNEVAHGGLWVEEDRDPEDFWTDYPRLGSALLTIIAAYGGYEGPVLINAFKMSIETIREIKET